MRHAMQCNKRLQKIYEEVEEKKQALKKMKKRWGLCFVAGAAPCCQIEIKKK